MFNPSSKLAPRAHLPIEEPEDAPPPENPPAPGPEPRIADAREIRLAPPPRATPDSAPATPEIAVMAAREAARSAASLTELREILAKFEGCALRTTAKQLVFADGNPQARVMFVGEAPGREEDLEGLPFVGRSGKLLDLMMAAMRSPAWRATAPHCSSRRIVGAWRNR